jgi:hypothetical protein
MVSVSAKKVLKKISCLCTFKSREMTNTVGTKQHRGGWGEEGVKTKKSKIHWPCWFRLGFNRSKKHNLYEPLLFRTRRFLATERLIFRHEGRELSNRKEREEVMGGNQRGNKVKRGKERDRGGEGGRGGEEVRERFMQ